MTRIGLNGDASAKWVGKPRVLHVGKFHSAHSGGIGTHLSNLCRELRKSIDVRIVAAADDWRAVEETLGGVTVSQMASPLTLFSGRQQAAGAMKISGYGAQLVHIHLPNATAILGYLASDYQGRLIVTYHGDTVRQRFLGTMLEPLLHGVLRRSAAIIVTSEEYVRTSPILPAYANRCHVIPYGIRLDQFDRCDPAAIGEIRKQYGDRIVLSVGHLVHYKGFEILIRAMRRVQGRLLIIGDGPLRSSLGQIVAKLNLTDKVVFLGDLKNESVRPYYHACDVFALASIARSDAFGAVQIEAMAAGKPVVNTQVDSGVPYVSIDGITGITVPPSDSDAMAWGLNKLLEEPAVRETYGAAARLRAEQEFSLEVMASRTLSLYERVMALPSGSMLQSSEFEFARPAEISEIPVM